MLPIRYVRRGRRLLHQQCWLWGQDVRRAEGNLLLEYGFERERAADGATSTQYTLTTSSQVTVRLWGFGFFYGVADEGVFLNRFQFQPLRVEGASGFLTPRDFDDCARSENYGLLAEAVLWIARYEQWVLKKQGKSYRDRCVSGWDKRAIRCEDVPLFWSGLSREIAGLDGKRVPITPAGRRASEDGSVVVATG